MVRDTKAGTTLVKTGRAACWSLYCSSPGDSYEGIPY